MSDELIKKQESEEQTDASAPQNKDIELPLRIIESIEQENGSIRVGFVGVDLSPKEHLYLLALQTKNNKGFFTAVVE